MTSQRTPTNRPLHFGIVAGQHNRQWDELKEQFKWADESGFDSAWAFDHFMSLQKGDEMGPCLEGYTLLSALAMVTEKVKLGLMVTGITHRYPAVLLKEVTTLDHVSNGRAILGVGAAWQEREHEMYGMKFPPPRDRVDMFGEAMEMFRLLETQERTTFNGKHFSLDNAAFEPKPVQGHVPIMIGSTGKRMMRHIARYGDMWDGGGTPEEYGKLIDRLQSLCSEIGRDPSEIELALQRGGDAIQSEDAFRKHVKSYAAIGVTQFLVSIPTGTPNATLRKIAGEVIPELREAHSSGQLDRT